MRAIHAQDLWTRSRPQPPAGVRGDPRHARLCRLSEAEYFAREHVIVSYNGDLRGIVEDPFEKTRKIRCSVSSFANPGADDGRL